MLPKPNEGSLILAGAGGEKDQAGVECLGVGSHPLDISDAERGRRHRSNQKAWREKNRDHIKQYMRRWWEQNQDKKKSYKYANKVGATTVQLVGLMASQGGLCALCRESIAVSRHLDHKLPKSRGGGSEIGNYQWLCPPCNTAKGQMTNEELIAHIRKILALA